MAAEATTPPGRVASPVEVDGDVYFDAPIDFEGIDDEDPCVGDTEVYLKQDHRGGTLEKRKEKIRLLRARVLADKSFAGERVETEEPPRPILPQSRDPPSAMHGFASGCATPGVRVGGGGTGEEPLQPPTPTSALTCSVTQARAHLTSPTTTSSAECPGAALYEDRSNATMERFLRARSFDVEVSAALFIEHRRGPPRRLRSPLSPPQRHREFSERPRSFRPRETSRRWRQSFNWKVHPSLMPKRLPTMVAALHGYCKDGLPLLVVIGRNHIACVPRGGGALSHWGRLRFCRIFARRPRCDGPPAPPPTTAHLAAVRAATWTRSATSSRTPSCALLSPPAPPYSRSLPPRTRPCPRARPPPTNHTRTTGQDHEPPHPGAAVPLPRRPERPLVRQRRHLGARYFPTHRLLSPRLRRARALACDASFLITSPRMRAGDHRVF